MQAIQSISRLLPIQKSILYTMLRNKDSDFYLEQCCYRLKGKIDIEKVEHAWQYVVNKHDALRGYFVWHKLREPVFVILKEKKIKCIICDIRQSEDMQEDKCRHERIQEWNKGVDITVDPMRITILILSDTECEMIITLNHILFDGWSNAIIMNDFYRYYLYLMGEAIIFHDKTTSVNYSNYIKHELKRTDNPQCIDFWKRYLSDLSGKDYPSIYGKKQMEEEKLKIPEEVLNKVNKYCKLHSVSFANLFYLLWAFIESTEGGCKDVWEAVTLSGRDMNDMDCLNGLVGVFIKTMPLRIRWDSQSSMESLFIKIKKELWEIDKHKYISGLELFNLNPKLNAAMNKILVVQNYPVDSILVYKERVVSIELVSSFYKPDADLIVSNSTFRDSNYIKLLYNNKIYTANHINKIGNKFLQAFQYLADNSDKQITAEMICNCIK
ncbi:hypothetical protein acsn021_17460 [Anaerocolumna cellulosilytica]|uniref:Uncharacterized protein n=1 Tax=Anaerocolumna cellulosilytica TaxID=433286 RepID=A0A6S6R272_9FIRM|nr:condensation domain-containing protein [Anaerocolumna cellulosilytica]MBB5194860.1 hypothetical protein [Anaerocolumna cellulosilytica]BCJ94177.1 hypothetical protein acsn021_17460 [Anaerocolumna cellulosilytica]